MRTAVLDFGSFDDAREAHAYLKEKLGFPDYYGHKLDALYDVLTELSEDTEILTASGGSPFVADFLRVLRDAEKASPHLSVRRVVLISYFTFAL